MHLSMPRFSNKKSHRPAAEPASTKNPNLAKPKSHSKQPAPASRPLSLTPPPPPSGAAGSTGKKGGGG